MNNKKISIIIPAYNAEKRIGDCLDSIKNQSYKNIEVIIVNDGSVDQTLNIIQNYDYGSLKHVIINKKNEGVSRARNKGIEEASGDYIIFLDSDDTLLPNAINSVSNLFEDNIDVIKMSYYLEYVDKKIDACCVEKCGLYGKDGINQLIMNIITGISTGLATQFIIKKDIITSNNILYPEDIKYMEDLIFILELLNRCNSIYITSEKIYNYYQSDVSVSKSINVDGRIKGINNRYNYSIKYFEEDKNKEHKSEFLNYIVSLYLKTEKYIIYKKDLREKYSNVIISNVNNIVVSNKLKLSIGNKVVYFLVKKKAIIVLKLFLSLYNFKNFLKGARNYD